MFGPPFSHHFSKYQVALKTSSDLCKTIGFYARDDLLRLPLIFQFIFFIYTKHFTYEYIFTQSFHRLISRTTPLVFTERLIQLRTVLSLLCYILLYYRNLKTIILVGYKIARHRHI